MHSKEIFPEERQSAIMEQKLTINYNNKPCYDIIFSKDFLALPELLSAFGVKDKKIAIITDTNVEPLYGDTLLNLITPICSKCIMFSFQAGEASKTLDTLKNIDSFLIEHEIDRKDMIIALGGGVVGDVAGFAAATYLRGVDYIQIPTTLLAQVDSSIGGKTAVDLDGFKNMIGAFYMPKLVYMNISTLETLSERQYFSGFAEVMKHALIKSNKFYEWLLENMYDIQDRNQDVLLEMIVKSCTIKKIVVEKDPLEQNERAILNFGHTIGHAIEKFLNFKLYHGECVALGCVAAAFISWKREWLTMEEYYEVRDMFVPFNLPISIDNINIDEVLQLTKADKKMESGSIKFILLKAVGKAIIDREVTDENILDALNEIYYSEETFD